MKLSGRWISCIIFWKRYWCETVITLLLSQDNYLCMKFYLWPQGEVKMCDGAYICGDFLSGLKDFMELHYGKCSLCSSVFGIWLIVTLPGTESHMTSLTLLLHVWPLFFFLFICLLLFPLPYGSAIIWSTIKARVQWPRETNALQLKKHKQIKKMTLSTSQHWRSV